MRRLAIVLALALFIAPARAETNRDPLALIRSIYRAYVAATERGPHIENIYSRRLQGLIDEDARNTPGGDAGTIDWDVFVDGNNWELSSIRVAQVFNTGRRAQVRADFISLKARHHMVFDLVRERGRWKVDDIRSMKVPSWTRPVWTMSKILTGAPDAFPDEPKPNAPKPEEPK